jgi:hypothetical protein
MKKVTDPALLHQLGGFDEGAAMRELYPDETPVRNKVSDPAILAQLNGEKNQPKIGMGETLRDNALQGATFGLGNRAQAGLAGLIQSGITGQTLSETYKQAREVGSQRMKAGMEENPGTAIVANILGALGTGGLAAGTKAGAALGGSLRSGGLGARALKGAASGAASGAAYGAGTADYGKSGEGAIQGGIFGGAIGGAAPLAGAAYRGVRGALSKSVPGVKNLVLPPEPRKFAEQKVLQRLSDDNMTIGGLSSRLQKSPSGSAIVDVGRTNIERLGESAANIPGSGANTAGRFIAQRASEASKRIKGDISQYVGRGDLSTVADDIMKKGEELASPLYEKAFTSNKDISSPVVNRILKTDAGKKALSYAAQRMNNKMALMGVPDKELAEQAKLAGTYASGGISRGLKLRTLDYVKQGLDDQVGALYRAGEKGAGNDIRNLARGLRNELDNLDVSGAYKEARNVWAGTMQGQEALESGRNFLKFDTPELRKFYSGMGVAEKELFRVGVAQKLRDAVNNTPDRGNIAKNIFGRQEYRDKLQSVLEHGEFGKLRASLMREDKMHLLHNRLIGNSRTLLRQEEIADLMKDPSELVAAVGSGGKSLGLKAAKNYIVNRYQGINRETAGEIANILFERSPDKQRQIIQRLQNRALAGSKQDMRAYVLLNNISPNKNSIPLIPGNIAGMLAQ